jgi:hypothetical protein
MFYEFQIRFTSRLASVGKRPYYYYDEKKAVIGWMVHNNYNMFLLYMYTHYLLSHQSYPYFQTIGFYKISKS